MCGIVGVLGDNDASHLIVAALQRLEYRGYDSAGVATLRGGHIERRRAQGKLSNLARLLEQEPIAGAVGIGHTRWATHGAPTVRNAHPHATAHVAVVHNGIIENFRALRTELEAGGVVFESDTDTEVVVQLTTHFMNRGLAPEDAAAATLSRLEGAFALAFIFDGCDDLMIGARRGSPLAVGWGDGAMYLGSDAIALAPMTDRVTYLEDGDWAVLTRAGAQIYDAEGRLAQRETQIVSVDSMIVDKGEYRHYMAKEIHEQPAVVGYTIAPWLDPATGRVKELEGFDWATTPRLSMVACGTAYFATHVGQYWLTQIARLPTDVDIASEFRYREPVFTPGGTCMFVSQSGETADTLAALEHAQAAGQRIASVVNVPESAIARRAHALYPTKAGPEIGVASTKAFTCQLSVLAALTIGVARARGTIDEETIDRLSTALTKVPRLIAEALHAEPEVAAVARELSGATDILYLGRGRMYPIALEGALKMKEITYIHAEGYASGELKHGPIALIDNDTPVIVIAPMDELFSKTVSNMQEVAARGGRVVLITDRAGAEHAGADAWRTLVMPDCDPFVAPIVYAAPVQLLAYHAAVAKGTDVDQPRNLAKSVTVE